MASSKHCVTVTLLLLFIGVTFTEAITVPITDTSDPYVQSFAHFAIDEYNSWGRPSHLYLIEVSSGYVYFDKRNETSIYANLDLKAANCSRGDAPGYYTALVHTYPLLGNPTLTLLKFGPKE